MTHTKYTINADIPKALDFVFVSDLHNCDNTPVLTAVDKYNPDALLIGGDLIHNNKVYKKGFEFIEKTASKYPTFCSLGNHEKRFRQDIKTLLEERGAVILDNTYVSFKGIYIGGLSSGYTCDAYQSKLKYTPAPYTGWLDEFEKCEGYKLLLSHHPEYYERYIKRYNIDLILSGHAHGGQWRFFGRGIFAPGQGIFPKYTSGMYDNRLIVGRGLGNPHSIPRINNKPELIVINLVSHR